MSAFRRVATNAGWNLLGNVLPLLAALAAVPFLVERMGTSRFGALSLAWVLIGYFTLFDLGLGRALTKMVAERADRVGANELSSLCSSTIAMVSMLGVLGALLLLSSAPWILDRAGRIEDSAIKSEALAALGWVAAGIPLAVATAALRGVLEGFQRFRLLNAIRVPSGVALFAAPCASAAITPRLDCAIAAVVLTRLVVLVAHAVPAHALAPIRIAAIHQRWAKPLLTFGGWLTVSNIVGPMIVHLDRFVVAAVLSSTAVAYYAAPFDVVSRLLLIPTALTAALFPALTNLQARDAVAARALRRSAQHLTFATVIVVVSIGIVAARPALALWLGPDFATQSARTMQILLVGFALNAMAQIPFTALHSLGCTRQTALLHLAELLPFVGLLLLLVRHWGIEGAAVAWTLRAFLDLGALTWMSRAMERRVRERATGALG